MTDLLERLAAANPVGTDELAPSIEDVWRRLDDGPLPQPAARRRMPRTVGTLRRRGLWRLAGVGVGVATAGVALLALGTTGGGPPSAFAGWTATPTRPASGETQAALKQCRSQLAQPGGGGRSAIPTGGWQPGITDTRGPVTATVLHSGSASATCLSGASFTSTAATVADSYLQEWRLSGSAAGRSAPPSVSGLGVSVPDSGPIITQALQAELTTSAALHVRRGAGRRRRDSRDARAIGRQRRPRHGRRPIIHSLVAGQRHRQLGAGAECLRSEHAAARRHPAVDAAGTVSELVLDDTLARHGTGC